MEALFGFVMFILSIPTLIVILLILDKLFDKVDAILDRFNL